MLRNCLLLGFLVALLSFAFAEDKPPAFTNADLSKYKRSNDNSASQMQSAPQQFYENKNHQADQSERSAYESWCSTGTTYRNRVFRAKDDVREAEEKYKTAMNEYEIYKLYKGKMGKPYAYTTAQYNLESAKQRLKDAEEQLSDLEDQAHRKGVKQGWLRCQK
jgi:hypothetical protein